MANKDVVFVAFDFNENKEMGILEWIFDHFELDETSLVLTNLYTDPWDNIKHTKHIENKYLPRCRKEKFEARILIPQEKREGLLLELINKHGMTKLITSSGWIRCVVENYSVDFSCRIWGIHADRKKLVFIRDDESVGEMEMMEYLPNEDGLHKQTLQQYPLKKNKVFVALGQYSDAEMVFDWVFQNFEKEKTKLVITCLFTLGDREALFIKATQSNYLPRCQRKKFEAEMLVPHSKLHEGATLELITKHGMERLVICTFWTGYVLENLGTIPNNSCMIWVLHEDTGKLVHFRDAREIKLLQKENDMHQQKVERRHLSKEYKGLLIEKPQSNEKIEEISQKLQEEQNRMSKELNQPKEDHDKLQEKLSDAIEENKQLQTEIEEMKNKEQEANEQKKIMEKNFVDSEVARQNLEIALKKVEDVRDMLQEDQNYASQEIHELKERLQSLQKDYTKVQPERDNIIQEAERLKEERNRSDFTVQE